MVSTAPVELSAALMKYLPEADQEKVQNMANALVKYWYQPNVASASTQDVKTTLFAVQKLLKGKNVRK